VHTPKARIADYTQAIMDLGATVCTPRRPDCGRCPQRRTCAALREDRTASLPMRRPARVLPERQTIFIVLRDRRGRVLLQRRPPQGVWPGLWSLPEASTEQDARTTAMQWADLDGRAGNALPTIKHGFTHYTLQASPIEWRGASIRRAVADTPDLRWCDRAGIAELGIPAPVRKLLLCDAARDRP
jgi:A/G-specific adenine glycosylase